MSFDLDWLNEGKSNKKNLQQVSPSKNPNQLKKLEQENKALKKQYQALKHHELSEENMIHYFMGIKQAKLYELTRFFDLRAAHEIEKVLKILLKKQVVRKYKNGWFKISPYYKKGVKESK